MSERARPRAPGWATKILFGFWIVVYLPLQWMVVASLRSSEGWTGRWYREVFQDFVLIEAAGRSLWVALATALVSPVVGGLAAIALMRREFIGRRTLEVMSAVSLALPELIFALSLLSWFFILGWPLSLVTVGIAHITFSLAFVILIVGSRLAQLDLSTIEAARDLGASEFQVVWKIIFPQLGPALVLASALSFLLSFDDFLITFFVSGVGSDTLPIKLYQSLKAGTSPKLSALATLILLVCVAVLGAMRFFWSLRKSPTRG